MKEIKLTGREMAVLKAIDYANGSTGTEITEHTHIEPEDVVDILNGLCEVGYIEPSPFVEKVSVADYAARLFEVNPSYAQQLNEALRRRR
jgi:DNA-binding IclR family transcriptional regulator